MTLTCTFSQRSTLTIEWEGEPWRNVHTAIFGRNPSLPQHCVTFEEFQEEFFKLEYRLAKVYAFRRLAAMSMLSTTLEKSLRTRFVSENTIERVIHELRECGYLNDQEWTNSFVRQQVQKKVGPKSITAKLAAKGVSSEHIEDYTQGAFEGINQSKLIQELLQTKYRKKNLKDFREKQKVIASLVRRGFDLSEILDILRIET